MSFLAFMNRPVGRAIRIAVGLLMIAYGFTTGGSTAGVVVALLGLAPLLTGVFGICPVCAMRRTSCPVR